MEANCTQFKTQVNRIKGQVNGVERMINEGRDVTEIIQQVSAVRAALSRLAVDLLKNESSACFQNKSKEDKLKQFEELVTTFFKVT